MNIAAMVKRVLRFLFISAIVLVFTSCATTSPHALTVADSSMGMEGEEWGDTGEVSGENVSTDFAAIGEEQLADVQVLASLPADGMGVELAQNMGSAQMVIRTAGDSINYNVSRLSSPSRLVLDVTEEGGISGAPTRLNRIFEVSNNEYVSRIRVGAHPDKSRIVLDLREISDLSYNAEAEGADLVVTLASDTIIAQNTTDSVMAAQDSMMAAQDSMMAAPAADFIEESNTPEDTAAPVIPVATEPTDKAEMPIEQDVVLSNVPELESLTIKTVPGEGNALIAQMESAGFFSLKRTAPSEYVLRLEGASFDPMEIGTVLAPPQSGAIRSARPVIEGNDTLLRIFALPNSSLVAKTRGNTIVVEPEIFLAPSDPADIRAQADIEEAAADEAAVELDEGEATDLAELEGEVSALLDEAPKYTGRQISLDLQDTDIDNALRIIAEVSNLNIIASDDVTGKVTLRLIDVPWDQALDVILKTNGLDKVLEGNVMRIAPIEKLRQEREALKQAKEAEEELEPLVVKYVRISYAKASELRPLVETVISERGTVTYDERTNQLIVKDIRRGVKNVAELVARLDLRTPQVLLETQIVEAQRSFLREFGSELGFNYIQSPETGNATGKNFPNSIDIGGSVDPSAPGIGVSFPGAVDLTGGSAVSFLLDSADGTRSLDVRLSALENEGRVRIVSRPAVATTNNQQAVIKAVEKIRVKTPSGGLSVATGSGASAAGSGGVATETIEIGIVLEVTPQASPDYFVLLDINAKSSTLGSTVVDGIPSEVERSATSTVLVSSGQTFAMGGIYKITDRDSVEGVPFLKDVPFLGHLFRRQGVDNTDEELIFFITPRIVEGSFDDAAMKLSS